MNIQRFRKAKIKNRKSLCRSFRECDLQRNYGREIFSQREKSSSRRRLKSALAGRGGTRFKGSYWKERQ